MRVPACTASSSWSRSGGRARRAGAALRRSENDGYGLVVLDDDLPNLPDSEVVRTVSRWAPPAFVVRLPAATGRKSWRCSRESCSVDWQWPARGQSLAADRNLRLAVVSAPWLYSVASSGGQSTSRNPWR